VGVAAIVLVAVPEAVAVVLVVALEASMERARGKAVVEAPRAWEVVAAAAALVAAVEAVVVAVAVAVAVVAAAGGSEIMKRSKTMKAQSLHSHISTIVLAATVISISLVAIAITPITRAQNSTAKGKTFATAEEAADALIDAAEKFDQAALTEILGPDSYDIVHTGEPAHDREVAQEFATKARAKKTIKVQKNNPRRAILEIGDEDWPFAVPIVKVGSTWSFDTAAGRQELLFRRIGGNELDAIEICHRYVEAQHEYALMKRTGGVNQYAQRIISTPGKQDGLAWKNEDGTWGGPIGEKVAAAIERGYSSRTEPFHGYFFRVLKGQGPAAPLGQLDFVVKDVMIGGFALIAFPAQYRLTGVKTFMVSHDGVVYEKDLGPKTSELAPAIDRFNPDKSWTPVVEQ
jgi:hypothetical protein